MISMQMSALPRIFSLLALAAIAVATDPSLAQSSPATYEGKLVKIGKGSAHTVVRASATGTPESIGVIFTPGMLDGLPSAAKGGDPNFPYALPMPAQGPKTVVNHVVINWESAGHPPPGVYDVPHFDFHFYLISQAEQDKIAFNSPNESADQSQQPAAELLPAGYVLPPGTAVSRMGVHAINPSASEFQKQPFTATFIYGYYNKQLVFIEPMTTLAYLKSKPSFSAPVARPAAYAKPGAYPSAYSIRYDTTNKVFEVLLQELN